MSITEHQSTLAFDDQGSGVPVVLLPGLTFRRESWRPIAERLRGDVRTIVVDLPAQGGSAGPPRALEDVAAEVHRLLEGLGVTEPIVVGHSIAGAITGIYAARFPVRGAVSVDQALDIRPFAAMVRRLEPALRGPSFAQAFAPIMESIGVELLPEPVRSQTRAAQEVRQDVVLGYWQQLLTTDAAALQAEIEATAARVTAPFLFVFGRELEPREREHLHAHVRTLELEEWPGSGHCVHLADPDRFTARLREFVSACVRA